MNPALRGGRRAGPLRRRGLVVGITVIAGALALSACNAKTTTPGKKSALDTIKKNGKLVVATDASYAPNEFKQNGQLVGFDVDLANAIAKKLGVTADVQDVKIDNILPALQARSTTSASPPSPTTSSGSRASTSSPTSPRVRA